MDSIFFGGKNESTIFATCSAELIFTVKSKRAIAGMKIFLTSPKNCTLIFPSQKKLNRYPNYRDEFIRIVTIIFLIKF